jgi:hypothetical protein
MVLTGLLLSLVGGAFATGNPIFAQEDHLLRLRDLPVGAIDPRTETYTPEQPYHPINRYAVSSFPNLPEDEEKVLFSYQEVRSFSAFLQREKAVVAHYIYAYETAETAGAAADILRKRGFSDRQDIKILNAERLQERALRGHAVTIEDREGTPIYWCIGHKGKTLTLLMVDGLEKSAVDSVADAVMEKLFEKYE